jgi:heme-degrading monooxygenase HmoA
MIVRVFRARVHPGKEDEFERLVIETGVPMVKAAEGFTRVTAGKRRWNEQPEFVVVTHWRSLDARPAEPPRRIVARQAGARLIP